MGATASPLRGYGADVSPLPNIKLAGSEADCLIQSPTRLSSTTEMCEIESCFFSLARSQSSQRAAAEGATKASHDLFISGSAPLNSPECSLICRDPTTKSEVRPALELPAWRKWPSSICAAAIERCQRRWGRTLVVSRAACSTQRACWRSPTLPATLPATHERKTRWSRHSSALRPRWVRHYRILMILSPR